jgi:hypothetical protein
VQISRAPRFRAAASAHDAAAPLESPGRCASPAKPFFQEVFEILNLLFDF